MKEAYDIFVKSVNVLDYRSDGVQVWENAKKVYETSTSKIESQLTHILKQKLEKAGTANEMFQVFAVYNKLFMRPKIRGAITQYQS